jgi:hypothetical protein
MQQLLGVIPKPGDFGRAENPALLSRLQKPTAQPPCARDDTQSFFSEALKFQAVLGGVNFLCVQPGHFLQVVELRELAILFPVLDHRISLLFR